MARDQSEAKIISLWWKTKIVALATAIGFLFGLGFAIWEMGPVREHVVLNRVGALFVASRLHIEIGAIFPYARQAADFYLATSLARSGQFLQLTDGIKKLRFYSTLGAAWAFCAAALILMRRDSGSQH